MTAVVSGRTAGRCNHRNLNQKSNNAQSFLPREVETRRQRQERRPSQKVPTCNPQSHRTFTQELHSTPKEREGNGQQKRVATNGTDQREGRGRRNDNEETTHDKTAMNLFSHESTSCEYPGNIIGQNRPIGAVTGSAPELPPTPSKPPPTVARASWDSKLTSNRSSLDRINNLLSDTSRCEVVVADRVGEYWPHARKIKIALNGTENAHFVKITTAYFVTYVCR